MPHSRGHGSAPRRPTEFQLPDVGSAFQPTAGGDFSPAQAVSAVTRSLNAGLKHADRRAAETQRQRFDEADALIEGQLLLNRTLTEKQFYEDNKENAPWLEGLGPWVQQRFQFQRGANAGGDAMRKIMEQEYESPEDADAAVQAALEAFAAGDGKANPEGLAGFAGMIERERNTFLTEETVKQGQRNIAKAEAEVGLAVEGEIKSQLDEGGLDDPEGLKLFVEGLREQHSLGATTTQEQYDRIILSAVDAVVAQKEYKPMGASVYEALRDEGIITTPQLRAILTDREDRIAASAEEDSIRENSVHSADVALATRRWKVAVRAWKIKNPNEETLPDRLQPSALVEAPLDFFHDLLSDEARGRDFTVALSTQDYGRLRLQAFNAETPEEVAAAYAAADENANGLGTRLGSIHQILEAKENGRHPGYTDQAFNARRRFEAVLTDAGFLPDKVADFQQQFDVKRETAPDGDPFDQARQISTEFIAARDAEDAAGQAADRAPRTVAELTAALAALDEEIAKMEEGFAKAAATSVRFEEARTARFAEAVDPVPEDPAVPKYLSQRVAEARTELSQQFQETIDAANADRDLKQRQLTNSRRRRRQLELRREHLEYAEPYRDDPEKQTMVEAYSRPRSATVRDLRLGLSPQ